MASSRASIPRCAFGRRASVASSHMSNRQGSLSESQKMHIPIVPAFAGWSDSVRVFRLLQAFRRRGHLAASLDPLRGSLHRNLDPGEPIAWRLGGRHGQEIDRIDTCQLLHGYPHIDLGVFGLQDHGIDEFLPDGIDIPSSWGPPPTKPGSPSMGTSKWTFRNVIEHLRTCYAGTVSVETQHMESPLEEDWLHERFESRPQFHASEPIDSANRNRKRALSRLIRTHQLEEFFGKRYMKSKRFGIEGGDALIPGLWAMLENAAELGMENVQFGMAHRGRLNVLVNLMGKKVSAVCSEFGENCEMIGDVKYHLGSTGIVDVDGREVHVTMSPNPSHLEIVNAVVLGMTRAKQDYTGDQSMRKGMAVLIHGDAAFCGQGVVAESMQLAHLPAFTTGGTIHVVVNNLVGFTTDPRFARSSYHCTNLAKTIGAPIIHVNADDVNAVLWAFRLAAEYRQTWCSDVVVDLVCYRRYGHSELDQGGITQPLTHNIVKNHEPVLMRYSKELIASGVISQDEFDTQVEEVVSEFEAGYHHSMAETKQMSDWDVNQWKERPFNVTGLPVQRLKDIGSACSRIPENFQAHPTVDKLLSSRRRQLDKGVIDWALAEQLAIGSLLLHFEPGVNGPPSGLKNYVEHPACPVRLSGQDVERGTFNHRHAMIYDQTSARPFSIFENMGLGPQASALVCNSSLSEQAVLGFEYGYSLEDNLALTIWEAQFGDFANCAQPIIDNFIASGESKWGTQSHLVMLLPHGFEGQGPEHSSARLERFLQLVDDDPDDLTPPDDAESDADLQSNTVHCNDAIEAVREAITCLRKGDECLHTALQSKAFAKAMERVASLQEVRDNVHNMGVVNISTPANVFHVLRRQVHRTFAKPLAMMTGKYLLQHLPCRSPLSHMDKGTRFLPVIFEGGPGDNMPLPASTGPVKRIILCSGKVFYELYHARAARKLGGQVVFARLEQIAPFPAMEIAICLSQYPDAEVMWVQEEPKNMGAWAYVGPRIATAMRQLHADSPGRHIKYVGRPATASPATGVFKLHKKQVRNILDEALALPSA